MMNRPFYLSFLWHMHQPYYRDLLRNHCFFPWVRLHGIKDYYEMPAILEAYPNVKQNFNLVPSLIEQIELYTNQGMSDDFLELTKKPAAELTPDEQEFVIFHFFLANWENMISPYPRFSELLERRGHYLGREEVRRAARYFTKQDYLDLQVWFNLAWFGPLQWQREPELAELIKKSKKFTESDKQMVIDKQFQILREIMPVYRRMQEQGQIEVSVSPYYHPILPLVCDTAIARVAMPSVKLPNPGYRYPEDAEAQVRMAVSFYQERFGRAPTGMWPSEGSVSDAVVAIAAKQGLKWIATDEGVLRHSLEWCPELSGDTAKKGILRPTDLYHPYLIGDTNAQVAIVFRDHVLSDLIGFSYYKMEPKDAVADFFTRIDQIAEQVANDPEDHLVSIILDGENAWEYYRNDGHDFLTLLYQKLNDHPYIKCVTLNDFITNHPPTRHLTQIHPGSWIDSNFAIWIGSEEDNASWEMLAQARSVVANEAKKGGVPPESLAQAEKSIYIAEGSDWNWWYGEEHSSGLDDQFDMLYRTHIANVYTSLGLEIPPEVTVPIKAAAKQFKLAPQWLTTPKLDGKVTDYFEWINAGQFEMSRSGGTMEPAHSVIKQVYCGFDVESVYLRFDTNMPIPTPEFCEIKIQIYSFKPKRKLFELTTRHCDSKCEATLVKKDPDNGGWVQKTELHSVVVDKIIELGIPFKELEAEAGDEVHLQLVVKHQEVTVQRCPPDGTILFTVPSETYGEQMWSA